MDPVISQTPKPATPNSGAKENRRVHGSGPHMAHSFLLLCSTALAALFCYLYITKPVSPPTQLQPQIQPQPQPEEVSEHASFSPSTPTAKAPTHAGLEETNLRVQHILTAETASGSSDRIELTVPVLYRSRHLRWSESEVETARILMEKLVRYQEQSRLLRDEGHDLLTAWNQLVSRALPSEALRADSPSLPSNQQLANDAPRPPGWTSTELIQIQGPDK